jgi:hypothetical protein
MHFRYTVGSAPHITHQRYLFRHQQMHDAREYHLELAILKACQRIFPLWLSPSPLPEPRHLLIDNPANKERSFTRSLHVRLSDIWRSLLLSSNVMTPAPTQPLGYRHISN